MRQLAWDVHYIGVWVSPHRTCIADAPMGQSTRPRALSPGILGFREFRSLGVELVVGNGSFLASYKHLTPSCQDFMCSTSPWQGKKFSSS